MQGILRADKPSDKPGADAIKINTNASPAMVDLDNNSQAYPSVIIADVWSPFVELQQLQQQMEQAFDQSYGRFRSLSDSEDIPFMPKLDFLDKGKYYSVKFDIPGMKKSDISIDLDGRKLTVSGKVDENKKEKTDHSFVTERNVGMFMRSIMLPQAVQDDKVEAEYNNGVLSIKIPKIITKSNKRKIEIK